MASSQFLTNNTTLFNILGSNQLLMQELSNLEENTFKHTVKPPA